MSTPDIRGPIPPRQASGSGGWPALAGQIPPLTEFGVTRPETGLSPSVALPFGQTTVLATAPNPAGLPCPLGGTGKTHLAAALARAHVTGGLASRAIWITASSRDAVLSGYAQALRDEGVSDRGEGPERASAQFLDRLRLAQQPWLVVLDDLSDPAVMEGLWPDPDTTLVLVTTEAPRAAVEAHNPQLVEVGAFSPREASAYLNEALHANPDQRLGALDLAADLGFLPAVLTQAAAFLIETGMDCRAYRSYLAERRGRLAVPDGYSPAVGGVWSLSAELADRMSPAGLARRALTLLAMLAPQGVPYEVLVSPAARAYLGGHPAAPSADEDSVRVAVQSLARAGLVTLNGAAGTVLTHPIVQAIARQNLPGPDYGRAVHAAADAVAQTWSRRDLPPALQPALRACTAKLQEAGGRLLWTQGCHAALLHAGQNLDATGLTGPAFAYWQTMLDVSERLLGPDHDHTHTIRESFANACAASGNPGQAVAIFEHVLADCERALGVSHPETVAARARLAEAYRMAGRGEDAVGLAEMTLDYCVRRFGPGHADTQAARQDLARAYLSAGRLDQGLAVFEQVLEEMGASLPPGHPDVMAVRKELAAAFRSSGRPKDSVALYERCLTDARALHGPSHPDTVAAREELAIAYLSAGRVKDAVGHLRRCIEDREQSLGPDHLHTVAARAKLADAYRGAKKFKDAIPLYERALADRERIQGPDDADTIAARSALAIAYHAARKLALAIPHYERALADCERVFGADHPQTAAARQNLNTAAADAHAVLGIDLRSSR